MISVFGKFHVREKKSRWVRNLHTGEFMVLGDKRVVTFRCSTVLREKLNGKGRGY
jgi:integration host factor subunit alpha